MPLKSSVSKPLAALDYVTAIAVVPDERVVAGAEERRVGAFAADDRVVAAAAVEDVVAVAAVEGVVAVAAEQLCWGSAALSIEIVSSPLLPAPISVLQRRLAALDGYAPPFTKFAQPRCGWP